MNGYFIYSDDDGVTIAETVYQRYGFVLKNETEVKDFIAELEEVSAKRFSISPPKEPLTPN